MEYVIAELHFPRCPRAYAPIFSCGPVDFSGLGAQNCMYDIQKSVFDR